MKCHRFIILSLPHSSGRWGFSKGKAKNVYLPICWIFSSLEGMTSALKKTMRQVSAPHLCKKPALVVQLDQIQPRLVELLLCWSNLCTTTIANWPQDKDVHIHTCPATHLEDTSPTSNLGRALLCRVTLPRVIALRSELIQRPTKYLVVEGKKCTQCAEPPNGEAGANSWDIPMSLRCVQCVRPKACLPPEGWREQQRFEKGGKKALERRQLNLIYWKIWKIEMRNGTTTSSAKAVSKAFRWPQCHQKRKLGKNIQPTNCCFKLNSKSALGH